MAEPGLLTVALPDPAATAALGAALATAILAVRPAGLTIDLAGELGAGKTALVRACLGALGHAGRVPSPTYTLVEPYAVAGYAVLHVDLYRLRSPDELEDLGLADELGRGTVAFIEWPARAGGRLPAGDIAIDLVADHRGRVARLVARTSPGRAVLAALALPGGTQRAVQE